MILPDSGLNLIIQSGNRIDSIMQSSRTRKVDFESKRIGGVIDELDSMEQAVFFALETVRYRHVIFSDNYGSEAECLIGKEKDYVYSEIKRMISEALLCDERISEVTDFDIDTKGENLTVNFAVKTIYGDVNKEVILDV